MQAVIRLANDYSILDVKTSVELGAMNDASVGTRIRGVQHCNQTK